MSSTILTLSMSVTLLLSISSRRGHFWFLKILFNVSKHLIQKKVFTLQGLEQLYCPFEITNSACDNYSFSLCFLMSYYVEKECTRKSNYSFPVCTTRSKIGYTFTYTANLVVSQKRTICLCVFLSAKFSNDFNCSKN